MIGWVEENGMYAIEDELELQKNHSCVYVSNTMLSFAIFKKQMQRGRKKESMHKNKMNIWIEKQRD